MSADLTRTKQSPAGLPWGLSGKESACQHRSRFDILVRKIPWRREWRPTPLHVYEEIHRQRSLVGYSPWGHKESDMTEHTPTNTAL